MSDDSRGNWTSASSAESDSLCPGKHLAQLGLPEPEASPEAAAGNRIHAALAISNPAGLSSEEVETYDLCKSAEQAFIEDWIGNPKAPPLIYREKRLRFSFDGETRHSGKPDFVLISDGRAAILDFKTGRAEVAENPRNLQLRDLAVLVARNYSVQEVTVAIIQPYAPKQPPCVYILDDILQAMAEMEKRVKASNNPKSPRVAGEVQCKYCRAKATCQAHAAWVGVALPDIQPLALPAISAKNWTPAQRSLFLDVEKAARDRLEQWKDEIRGLLQEDPNAAPGYRLREGRTTETVTDAQEVFRRFMANVNGTVELFMPCVKLGKTAFKDAVRAATGHKGKALEADLDALLAGCTESKQSAPTIEKAA